MSLSGGAVGRTSGEWNICWEDIVKKMELEDHTLYLPYSISASLYSFSVANIMCNSQGNRL